VHTVRRVRAEGWVEATVIVIDDQDRGCCSGIRSRPTFRQGIRQRFYAGEATATASRVQLDDLRDEEDDVWILGPEFRDDGQVRRKNAGGRLAVPHIVRSVMHHHDVGFLRRPSLQFRVGAATLRLFGARKRGASRILGQVGDAVATVTLAFYRLCPGADLIVHHCANKVEVRVPSINELLRHELDVTGAARDGITQRHDLPATRPTVRNGRRRH